MLKYLLSFLIAFSLTVGVRADESPKPFVAVFTCPEFQMQEWSTEKVDYISCSSDWKQFDEFLKSTARLAKERDEIVIDLDSHGENHGYLVMEKLIAGKFNFPQVASLGFIVNRIESRLPGKKITLLLEACYAGEVYKQGIRGCKFQTNKSYDQTYMEDCNHVPQFKIIGTTYHGYGVGNLTYMQWKKDCHMYWIDLRVMETNPMYEMWDEKRRNKEAQTMAKLWFILKNN